MIFEYFFKKLNNYLLTIAFSIRSKDYLFNILLLNTHYSIY